MTLRAIHDFELALLDPCLAMTERGMRIDDVKRQQMLADLAAARAPLEADVSAYVTQNVLVTHAARLAESKAHLFHKRVVCACCRNGKAKRVACWECAGFEKKPTAKQLRERSTFLQQSAPGVQHGDYVVVDVSPLKPCAVCAGAGASTRVVFNPASDTQLKIVLYELLKLPPRTKHKVLTTEEPALKSLLAFAAPEVGDFIRKLLRIGKLDTTASTLRRIAPGPDGRIRSVYNPAGTETGRFASSETFLIQSTNLNNMQKREAVEPMFDVRACFVPSEGCVFVEADFSGAEAWITACCSQDYALLELLRSGAKIHRWTAARALGKPESEVTEQEYSLYKTARHALNYGMQPPTFVQNVNEVADRTGVAITLAQGRKVYVDYHALHPNLAGLWWKNVQATLVRTGRLTTCFERMRTFYGRNRGEWLGETHREGIAHEPQSTIADLLNRGLLRWWRQHDGKVGNLLAQVYDSLLIETPRERATLCAQLAKRCLTEEIEVHGIKITVPVDVKVLESWAVTKGTM